MHIGTLQLVWHASSLQRRRHAITRRYAGTLAALLEPELQALVAGLSALPNPVLMKLSPGDMPGMPALLKAA